MKTKNRIRAKRNGIAVRAQSKTQAEKSASKVRHPRARAGRITVWVEMPNFLIRAVYAAAKRQGITHEEFFENAIRAKVERGGKGGVR